MIQVQEYEVDYTECELIAPAGQTVKTCADYVEANLNNATATCVCHKELKVPNDLEVRENRVFNAWAVLSRHSISSQGEVFMYYGLTNFYQNHRRYVKSRDDTQLLGHIDKDPSSDCDPFAIDPQTKKKYVPCGAIANSLFSGESWAFKLNCW